MRTTLDFDTARTIAISLVHSKFDYCNSLLQPSTVITQAITCYPKLLGSLGHFQLSFSTHNTWTTISHWLKDEQRNQYKLIFVTYSSLQHNSPLYLRRLLTMQTSHRPTRSTSVVILFKHSSERDAPALCWWSIWMSSSHSWPFPQASQNSSLPQVISTLAIFSSFITAPGTQPGTPMDSDLWSTI